MASSSSGTEDLRWKGHLSKIVEAILTGKAVPFLGADINLCNRPKTETGKAAPWTPDAHFPPSNQELATYLDTISAGMGPAYHQELCCPFSESQELDKLPEECPLRRGGAALRLPVQNVSQYLAASSEDGDTALYEALRELFATPYEPNSVHRFLASLPSLLRSRCKAVTYPLIVTACFDCALERAFEEAGEEFELVSFISEAQQGLFRHRAPDGTLRDVVEPNTYSYLDMGKRPVILKLYGGYESKSFLITEDHYIDYLSHRDMAELMPTSLLRILRADDTNIWFLGYGPSFWNQRVILRRLWQEKLDLSGKPWWAIQAHHDQIDLRIWDRYSVRVPHPSDLQLEDYIAEVEQRVRAAPMLTPVISPSSAAASSRENVFFSYSHQDIKWLKQIKDMLTPVIRDGSLNEWDDTQIQPGAKWREEIRAALASAKVAVLLVSAPFLKSEFIASEELPELLKAAENEGVIICPVVVDHCLYDESALKDYQAVNDTSKPLSGFTGAKRTQALEQIARKILDSFHRK